MPDTAQKTQATPTIIDVLVELKSLTSEQGEKLKLEQLNTGKDAKAIVVESNLVSALEIAKAEGKLLNIPFVDLTEIALSPTALNLIPQPVAQRYQLIPFDYNQPQNTLSLAMVNPLDLEAQEFVEKKAGAKIKPFISTASAIDEAIATGYFQSLAVEVKAAMGEIAPEGEVTKIVENLLPGQVIRESKVATVVIKILEFAIKARASDVHIEPQEDKTRVRYRIDGILHEKLILTKSIHDAVISRIKILSGMRIDEKRVPQDGRFNFKAGGQEVDLRVSCLPTSNGEKIVMRLLKKTGGVPDLPDLGLRGRALKNLEDAILRPHGIILVVGPTGSGKTTTLYSVLSRINTPRVNIVTLEDPIEYQIAGVNQVQVNPAAGLTFASGLRSFLRQDPNIVMIGEIRDKETMDLAIQASLTGHLVFSTLHTNDSASTLPRLLDLGAEPFLLASSMTCVTAQRICRRICPDCKEEYAPPPAIIEDIKNVLGKLYDQKSVRLSRGKKCPRCNDTGYLGRVGIFEVLPVSEKIARLILERSAASVIEKQAVEEGMIKMRQDGYLKVLEGITTIEEVLRVAQE